MASKMNPDDNAGAPAESAKIYATAPLSGGSWENVHRHSLRSVYEAPYDLKTANMFTSGSVFPTDFANHHSTWSTGKRTWWHRLTMQFSSKHHEREYQRWQWGKNRLRWILMTIVLWSWTSALYGSYFVLGFVSQHRGCNTFSQGYCPDEPYDPNKNYNWRADLAFCITGGNIPYMFLLGCYRYIRSDTICRYANYLFVGTIAVGLTINLGVRTLVVDPYGDAWHQGLLNLVAVVSIPIIGMIPCYLAALLCFANLIQMTATNWHRLGTDEYLAAPMVIAYLTVSTVVVIVVTGVLEALERQQFAITVGMTKVNRGLRDRLHGLQKELSSQAADLDTPIEKAIATIKSTMANPSLDRLTFENLQMVHLWLSNTDKLFTPALENQLNEGIAGVDEEQELWLLNLLSNPNRGVRRNLLEKIRAHRSRSSSGPNSGIFRGGGGQSSQQIDHEASEINAIYASINPLPGPSTPSTPILSKFDGDITTKLIEQPSQPLPPRPPILPGIGSPSIERHHAAHLRFNESPASSSHDISPPESPRISVGNRHPHQQSQLSQQQPHQAPPHIVTGRYNNIISTTPAGYKKKEPPRRGPVGLEIPRLEDSNRVKTLLEGIGNWNWSIFELETAMGPRTLSTMALHLMQTSGLVDRLNIPMDKLVRFLRKIESLYHPDVPYHNASHGADVLQAMHCFLNVSNMELRDVELFAAYIAAAVHDLDHPGLNNKFLIESHDAKAILYNDKSVLENHHLATAFTVMMKDETNILETLTNDEAHKFREQVIGMVMATDISEHFTTLALFKNKISASGSFDASANVSDRFALFQMLIKCADVSNLSREWSIYATWLQRVIREFVAQGDMEKKLNLPVSPFMDRDNINIPQSQLGFIDFICQPMIEILTKVTPLPPLLDNLLKNKEQLTHIRDKDVNVRLNKSRLSLASHGTGRGFAGWVSASSSSHGLPDHRP
ncbi:hypothetical protein PhCBS80983_g02741 [Powellomyces hirtus]|uniref:Phosphodiesterase n=1 Tax=Powellomyces hirtus TaxID=109895 RepID=A0A507E6R5_9FUNG|nr:hypothetical protein PhCBS80983_g02741 [Powellomyces hirtus]